jgi:hypothetical protein
MTNNIIRPINSYLTAAKLNAKANLVNDFYKIAESISAVTLIKSLWVFDESGTATTVKDKSISAHDVTLLESTDLTSVTAGTLQPDLQGLCPYLEFRSDNDLWYAADHNDFTFSNGSSADTAFSIVVLCAPGDVVDSILVAKSDDSLAGGREWVFLFNEASLIIAYFWDDSSGGWIGQYTADLSADLYGWHTYIMTYSANALPHGIQIYRDGVLLTTGPFFSGAYAYMENGDGVVGNHRIDAAGDVEFVGNHKYGVVSLWATELSAHNVKRIDWLLRSYAGVTI